ncbi:NitT/TauT family transport system substrate-binding protein [Advenella incenata]|uniref:Thiamine pyrimidine synthase n=1 Tax=Advenella incenata TaxID=267800 RepID=A0A4V6MEM0_9BURK|nr:NitT/TauT family transport system substrate-binding protein [Advenella incenata]
MKALLKKARQCVAAMVVCSWLPVAAAAETDLAVRLDWTPWAVQAPFHLAMQKGWFKAAGLNVRMEDGNGSVSTVQMLGAGDHFDVGHASLAAMMIGRDKGMPLKAIAPFMTSTDIGALVPSDSDIVGPAQLKGKKVLYTAGSLEAPFIDFFLKAGKLSRSDVDLLSVDASAKAATYAVKRADAVISTIPFILPSVTRQRQSRPLPFSDYGLDMVSFGLFTNEKKLEEKKEAIGKFASIVAYGWQYIMDGHEAEAVDAIVAQRPQARLDKGILAEQLNALKPYFPQDRKQQIGMINPDDFKKSVSTLHKVGSIRYKLDPDEYYVKDLIQPIANVAPEIVK